MFSADVLTVGEKQFAGLFQRRHELPPGRPPAAGYNNDLRDAPG